MVEGQSSQWDNIFMQTDFAYLNDSANHCDYIDVNKVQPNILLFINEYVTASLICLKSKSSHLFPQIESVRDRTGFWASTAPLERHTSIHTRIVSSNPAASILFITVKQD